MNRSQQVDLDEFLGRLRGRSANRPWKPMPALHTITSSRPNSATVLDTTVHGRSVGHIGRNRQRPAALTGNAVATSASSSARLAVITTDAPLRASRSAVARPMPDDAPVMRTTIWMDSA
jgi:hypothetical protein